MSTHKAILFLGDGMADEPVPALDGRTPLEAARTPAMDAIAAGGRCGTFRTLPRGFPTSSEVANMSVLGCDLAREYPGRGPLEALGCGVTLGPDDLAFRMNLVTLDEAGVLTDYAGGHPSADAAEGCIAALNESLGSDAATFHAGVSFRCLLVLHGAADRGDVRTEKPDDNQGERQDDHPPAAGDGPSAATAEQLQGLIASSREVLRAVPGEVNGIWPWSGGRGTRLRSFAERYGARGAVISAVDVIRGLGRALDMTVIDVPGATGYVDTNYEGKADAAAAALAEHDFVYLHVEAIDEVSHAGDLEAKLGCIEDFDRRCIGRALEAAGPDTAAMVLPDHPVPVRRRRHTRTPVPVALRYPGREPDAVMAFGEHSCPQGTLGALRGDALMRLLFADAAR